MSGIIQILPEAIANQIAAGEVVQRPASVVKELLENALDAGATDVQLVIQNGGKTLIQVIDNGKGMTEEDARLCFSRHATSKIRAAADLYSLRTFGFRGEAMASIAAVAQVVLRTRQAGQEVGTEVQIEGNHIVNLGPCATPEGTAISVRNLFFNVPARRNFLKGNPVETRHIQTELYRAALSRPDVRFRFMHNGDLIYDWPATDAKQRFVQLHPFLTALELISVSEQTDVLRVQGWLGAPHTARKARGEQYFVVNNRYVRDGLLHHAINSVFEPLTSGGAHPVYLLYIDIDPARVDINIHPTKTEVKFDDERSVYAVVHSAVRHAIGTLHNAPHVPPKGTAAGFEQGLYASSALAAGAGLATADDALTLNEFRRQRQGGTGSSGGRTTNTGRLPSFSPPPRPEDWQALYGALNLPLPPDETADKGHHNQAIAPPQPLFAPSPGAQAPVWVMGRVWVQPHAEGLLVVEPRAAARRLRYEAALRTTQTAADTPASGGQPSHRLLYPLTLALSGPDMVTLKEALPMLRSLGFDIQVLGASEVLILGLPLPLGNGKANALVNDLANLLGEPDAEAALQHRMALLLAAHTPADSLAGMSPGERAALVADLLASNEPRFAPDGTPASAIISPEQLAQFLG